MFDPVDPRQSLPALEHGILSYWREEDTFKRSVRQRSRAQEVLAGAGAGGGGREDSFSFYDGPPFATGLPHYGHLLAGTIKDVIPRYQTMRGKAVQRRFGWDCHGLPVEYEIEKEYGIQSRRQIEEMGVAAFNDLCRSAVQRYAKEWRVTVERMGRWVDMDWDYRTMDPDYMESIWWAFSALYARGLVYEGSKPMHVCPRCQTPLSNFEVTQGYKEVTDHAVTAMFELEDEPGTFVLAWTTTPWTLPGNLFLAFGKEIPYVKFRLGNNLFVASKQFWKTWEERKYAPIVKPGQDLPDAPQLVDTDLKAGSFVGKRYRPLFPYFEEQYKEKAFRIVEGDFVTTEEGTGVVHIAPGFGEDDFKVGAREGLSPPLQHLGMDGRFAAAVTDFAGMEVKPAGDPSKTDRAIAAYLKDRGKLFGEESHRHSYPHCWRCEAPLLNYATSSWFVAVEKIKEKMLAANAQTEWVPAHIRDGRFGKWLEGARDWAISRRRFWGTPLPIWRCAATGEIEVVGSRDELLARCPWRFAKLTMLRHGESEGNVAPRYQGMVPGTDLTKAGERQARDAGAFLKEANVAAIYCSPLARARRTAEIIAKRTGAKIIVDERVREVAFGDYEGKSVDHSDLTFVRARRAHKLETGQVESIYHFPGMETWRQVQERVAGFLREILPKHAGEHVVVVSHADPIINMKHFFTKEEPAKLCNQPYPGFAVPVSYFWDARRGDQLDLHKETVDEIRFPAGTDADALALTAVRHGESEWNVADRICGSEADPPLSAQGREQALDLLRTLKSGDFDAVISSPLARSRQTADIVAKRWGMDVVVMDAFREQDLGEWSGKTSAEVRRAHPEYPEDFLGSVSDVPGGESRSAFLRRVRAGLRELHERYRGKRVLLFSHRRTICAVDHLERGSPIWSPLPNCAVATFELRPMFERIPDVLDCWFESGSMPYAQSHFPFDFSSLRGKGRKAAAQRPPEVSAGTSEASHVIAAKPEQMPPGFPADFIAEGIDQTRGWFYTLIVLSSALFGRPAFEHCVVNGTVLAVDGKKMSKRLKNYPEPLELVEKFGADAVRFALMSSPAVRGEDLRFSEQLVQESLRGVLLPLWNTYAFFVTYANAARWEPAETRTASAHPLDAWIRAEAQDLVNRMTEQLDCYDLSATCAELHGTIDALTNWYVRLSRRRFAGKSGSPEDREGALATLYDVLLTVSQMLAPFCPFMAEAMYLNLVPGEHGSVHLTDWPKTRKLTKAETALREKTNLLRTIVSLGLRVRSERKVKLRSPLAKAIAAIPADMRKRRTFAPEDISLLRDELNVKAIEIVDDPGALARAVALVDARKAGPRLGARVQEVIAAGKRGEFAQEEDGSVLILEERLSPEEVRIVYRGREEIGAGETGIAGDRGIVVSLDVTVTPELRREGDARDLIRAIQQLRKDRGLAMQEKISLSLEGADDLVTHFRELLERETSSVLDGSAAGEEHTVEAGDRSVRVRFHRHS